jgi:ferredoxin-fold anticodon binding domain-containing protein
MCGFVRLGIVSVMMGFRVDSVIVVTIGMSSFVTLVGVMVAVGIVDIFNGVLLTQDYQ